ncbi:hypothetical protein OJ996_21835 [Luteolibacter sp. GHJ8]|uniref:Metallothionein n=1 Tax=Luteolibacter rhizosphaerae TaxID=2989719 RepID=A0ABT3G9D2_9BACT|nr:hypothetical protein [Luteolibacter rhizosphaerae]MCW1916247.1 hypothetical protein [Luteolibacter rhizosphaerae]
MKILLILLPVLLFSSCASTETATKKRYVCSCAADCKCVRESDKPGKCGCGKEMKLVE